MAYLKLDKDILGSSLWLEADITMVFITALLLAEPCTVLEPTPQLHVDALEETGFIVPPGRYGFVPAAGPGLIHAAAMPLERGMIALKKLGEPDKNSRSQEYSGRRLVRINGGYLILNFERWQSRDHTAAARMRRMRERKAENVPHQVQAEAVLRACSISDKRMIPVVAGAIEAHVKGQDWSPDKTAARMIEGYQAYTASARELRFTVSARKFFAQGWWLDSKLWPYEKQRRVI